MVTYFRADQPISLKAKSNVKNAWIDETSLVNKNKAVKKDVKPANPFEHIFG